MKYVSKVVGRCLTEYKLTDYNEQVKECRLFFRVSQFQSIDGMDFKRVEELGFRMDNVAYCGSGQKLYGVKDDRTIVKLMEIIDSSD